MLQIGSEIIYILFPNYFYKYSKYDFKVIKITLHYFLINFVIFEYKCNKNIEIII